MKNAGDRENDANGERELPEQCPWGGRGPESLRREWDALSQQPGCISTVTGEKAENLETDAGGKAHVVGEPKDVLLCLSSPRNRQLGNQPKVRVG